MLARDGHVSQRNDEWPHKDSIANTAHITLSRTHASKNDIPMKTNIGPPRIQSDPKMPNG